MSQSAYKTSPGSHLVIWLTGCLHSYIAEVIEEEPLRLKIGESGVYSNLKNGDFIVLENESTRLQSEEESALILKEYSDRGQPLVSGLRSLGVPQDGNLHTILPEQGVK